MKEIFERVSIRRYTEQPVEDEKIRAILRAAMAAPSAGNQQPWEFFVVRDREKLDALSRVTPYSGCTKRAAVAIVSAYREKLWAPAYAQIDMSIAMENLWLACGEQGLGGVWLGIAPIEDRMKAVEEILEIPEGLRAFAIFPLGYPAESRTQQDRFDESRIHFV
jgi:nitroreductase